MRRQAYRYNLIVPIRKFFLGLVVTVYGELPQTVRLRQVDIVDTVALEKDGFMSETIIYHRNLPNPHLFEPLFCTRV